MSLQRPNIYPVTCQRDRSHIFYKPSWWFEDSPEGAVLCEECKKSLPGSHWQKKPREGLPA